MDLNIHQTESKGRNEDNFKRVFCGLHPSIHLSVLVFFFCSLTHALVPLWRCVYTLSKDTRWIHACVHAYTHACHFFLEGLLIKPAWGRNYARERNSHPLPASKQHYGTGKREQRAKENEERGFVLRNKA